jgi:hypothetical protein
MGYPIAAGLISLNAPEKSRNSAGFTEFDKTVKSRLKTDNRAGRRRFESDHSPRRSIPLQLRRHRDAAPRPVGSLEPGMCRGCGINALARLG